MAHVHQLHVIHRDAKPANILLSRGPFLVMSGRHVEMKAKLADFGPARELPRMGIAKRRRMRDKECR